MAEGTVDAHLNTGLRLFVNRSLLLVSVRKDHELTGINFTYATVIFVGVLIALIWIAFAIRIGLHVLK